jgi:excinuclease ABC subunit A
VLVVEHDLEVIADADIVMDMGPKAGELGGEIMFLGGLEELRRSNASLTGQYMSGKKSIPVPKKRRDRPKGFIEIKGARKNNLKNVDVKIPLGVFTCITGVSGSGKSTLVHEILFPAVRAQVDDRTDGRSGFTSIEGAEQIDQIEMVDQSPIGRTPRSNPATYIHAFDLIRELFSTTHGAKIRGFGPGFFSFNVPGGRCEACEGSGIQTIEMQFLADLELTCEVCQGKRFKKEVLNVKYEEKNIDDVLNMTVAEAVKFFGAHATGKLIAKRLKFLDQVGMGYVRLGQSATTLSGGESQRVKLAEHLSHQEQGKHALFIFDEPTTGLHFDDIAKLLSSLNALVESGNTVVVIEHNMEVIKCADWVIDLGPEAGDKGGMIVAEGTPEKVAKVKNSYTGNFLAKYL